MPEILPSVSSRVTPSRYAMCAAVATRFIRATKNPRPRPISFPVGVFVRHLGSDQAVAEANQVLFFNRTESARVVEADRGRNETAGDVAVDRGDLLWLRRGRGAVRASSHLVTKLHHAALVGFDLRQMEGDVSVELLEEWDPITNQDRQDRITNFVG